MSSLQRVPKRRDELKILSSLSIVIKHKKHSVIMIPHDIH